MNTDKKLPKPASLHLSIPSLAGEAEQSGCNTGFGPQNLCPSVLLPVRTCAACANSLASLNLFNPFNPLTLLVAALPRWVFVSLLFNCGFQCGFRDLALWLGPGVRQRQQAGRTPNAGAQFVRSHRRWSRIHRIHPAQPQARQPDAFALSIWRSSRAINSY